MKIKCQDGSMVFLMNFEKKKRKLSTTDYTGKKSLKDWLNLKSEVQMIHNSCLDKNQSNIHEPLEDIFRRFSTRFFSN